MNKAVRSFIQRSQMIMAVFDTKMFLYALLLARQQRELKWTDRQAQMAFQLYIYILSHQRTRHYSPATQL